MRSSRLAPAIALLILLTALLPALAASAATPLSPRILLNGTELALPADQKALIIGGSTLVPVRAIFEALGAEIDWDEPTRTVIGRTAQTLIQLPIGAPEALMNGQPVTLSQPAQLIGGRTYVPLRFVSEALGARVRWDGQTSTVRITDKRPEVGGELNLWAQWEPAMLAPVFDAQNVPSLVRAVYGDGLIRTGRDAMLPEPALATAMPQVSMDGRTYTFTLRQGVTFQDGTEVTAEDFAFTYGMIMDPSYVGQWSHLKSVVESVRATDRYALEIRLRREQAAFPLSGAQVPPLPAHLLRGFSAGQLPRLLFWQQPVGAGPFRVKEWVRGSHLVLERSPDYWEALIDPEVGPWVETVRIRFASELQAWRSMVAGELDHLPMASPQYLTEWGGVLNSRTQVLTWDRSGHGELRLNHDRYPTNLPEVRQAMALAVDRAALVKAAFGPAAVPAAGSVPAFHWAANPAVQVREDRARAVRILEEAGFERNAAGYFERDGQELTVILAGSLGSALVDAVMDQSRADWEAIGIRVDARQAGFSILMDQILYPGEFNAAVSSFSYGSDPFGYLETFHAKSIVLTRDGHNTGFNRGHYRSAALDSLLDQAARTHDLAERAELYRQAQQILADDVAAIWLYVNRYHDLVSPRVRGARALDGLGAERYERWYLYEADIKEAK